MDSDKEMELNSSALLQLGNDSFCLQKAFQHLPSDYFRMVALVVLFVLGATINLCAFEHMRNNTPPGCASATVIQMHWLKQHLCITDLLVVFVYGLSELIWIYTYQWQASNGTCKLVQFGRMLAFYASSNLIACVAINRLMSLYAPAECRHQVTWRTGWLLGCAWVCALLCSLPQIWVWRTMRVRMCAGGDDWVQCNTQWDTLLGHSTDHSWQHWYNVFHLTTVFWLPFGVTAFCYSMLMVRIADLSGQRSDCSKVSRSQATADSHYGDIQVRVEYVDTPGIQAVEETAKPITTTTSQGQTPTRQPCKPAKQQQQQQLQVAAERTSSSSSHARHSRTTLAMAISLKLTLCYVACYMPYNAVQTLKILYGADWYARTFSERWDFLNVFIIVNSVLNPFIYGTFAAHDSAPHVLGTNHRMQKHCARL